jgi:protein-disulfide isomerase
VLHKNTLRASSRRLTLFVAAGVALFAACLATRAVAERVPVAVLMANEALPDIALGKSDAPVIIVEYASMTCTHCAALQATVYPKLKSGYVDTGKVRFILREFPLNDLDAAGFMLARCAGAGKRTDRRSPIRPAKELGVREPARRSSGGLLKQNGISQESFETCLKDQQLSENITRVRDRAYEDFKVSATPTFFIHGERVEGTLTFASIAAKIDALIAH